MEKITESLNKFANGPGLCSLKEVKDVAGFLKKYVKIRDTYKKSFGVDPLGLTLESQLAQTDWYLDRLTNKKS